MPNPTDDPKKPSVNADHNSNAVGSISAGGDISGNIHIGNVYQTPEDDLPLSSDEIENGLTRFAQYLPERAPVLQDSFLSIAKKLRATLGADQNSLSPALKAQREDGVNRMKLMCMEVTDISFRAICLGQNPPPYDSRPPFLGLFAFRPEDREFFFGRDALVQKLVARIKAHPFLAVLGASGSGKSSLVMAGLVPALEAQMSYLTPSSAPLSQLLTAKESASAKTVFVIDQFEELFTHPHDAAERADFIHALLDLTKTNRVVITMRADFWGEVAIYSDLKQAMQEHQELIAPMNVDELHSAIEKQAAVVGLRFDPTLSESILAEVKGEPGAMPLLQHALWELWNRRHGLWIKAEEYQAFGGVKQAIASTAEEVYASCSDFERARVRDIFLRLTRLDESGEGRDTRRRVLIEELIPVNSDSSITINLLNKLADARLIVKTEADVEVAHEALIRHWTRLTEWLNEDRDNLRLREGVSESAREWDASKRDDSLLNHRGGRLELALAMSKLLHYQLNPIEQAYLNACVALRHKEQRERERRLRYTVIASVVAAVIFLVLGSFGWVKSNEAVSQAGTAQANASAAETAKANAEIEKQNAIEQAKIARAGELAAQAVELHKNDLQLSLLLGIEAYNAADTVQTRSVLLSKTQNPFQLIGILGHQGNFSDGAKIAISPDGRTIATGGENHTIILWDIDKRLPIGEPLVGHTLIISSLAFSPDGITLASAGQGGTIILWNLLTHKQINQLITNSGIIDSIAFSPDGKIFAAGGNDGLITLWNMDTQTMTGELMSDNYLLGPDVAFSPDGKLLASTSTSCKEDGGTIGHTICQSKIILWETDNFASIADLPSNIGRLSDIIFSHDSKTLAAGGENGVALWDMSSNNFPSVLLDSEGVGSLDFSPDGKSLATGSKNITLWDLGTQTKIRQPFIGHSYEISSIKFSPDGKRIVSGGCNFNALNKIQLCDKGEVMLWNTENSNPIIILLTYGRSNRAYVVATSPDGNFLILNEDGNITLWDVIQEKEKGQLTKCADDSLGNILFSPNGIYIAEECKSNGVVYVWNTSSAQIVSEIPFDSIKNITFSPDNKLLAIRQENQIIILNLSTIKPAFSPLIVGSDGWKYLMGFSPDSRMIAASTCGKDKENPSSYCDPQILLWDITSSQPLQQLSIKGSEGTIHALAFSPNGSILASGGGGNGVQGGDSSIILWDPATGKQIGQPLKPLTGILFDVNSLSFSMDNKMLVSSDTADGVIFWDVVSHQVISQFQTEVADVGVAFSESGKSLITNTYGEVSFWDLDPLSWMRISCERAGRNLTEEEWSQYFPYEEYRVTCPQWPIEAVSTPVP